MSEKQQVQVDLDDIIQTLEYAQKAARKPVSVKEHTWVDALFAPPPDLTAYLARLGWCVFAPGILGLLYPFVAGWLWTNGYPMLVLVPTAAIIAVYYLVYVSAVKTAPSRILADSVNFWMALPVLVVCGVIALSLLGV